MESQTAGLTGTKMVGADYDRRLQVVIILFNKAPRIETVGNGVEVATARCWTEG